MTGVSTLRLLGVWGGTAASAVLLITGLLKAISLDAFRASVASWESVPAWSMQGVVVIVPLAELLLAVLFLMGFRRRTVAALSMVLLLVLSVWFAYEKSLNPDAACGCFGKWLNRGASLESVSAHLALNCLMIFCWGLFLGTTSRIRTPQAAVPLTPASLSRRGLTLIELLVSVSIIAVLASLALWGLAAARARSRLTVDQALLRSGAQAVLAYTADARGCFPYFADRSGGALAVIDAALPGPYEVPYFDARQVWHIYLSQGGYIPSWTSGEFLSPYRATPRTAATALLSDYWIPCVFFAQREYWSPYTRLAAPLQFGGVREAEVSSPSYKAILVPKFATASGGLPQTADPELTAFMGFVDGSVNSVGPGQRPPEYGNHGRGGSLFLGGSDQSMPGLHALNGVAGVDRNSR